MKKIIYISNGRALLLILLKEEIIKEKNIYITSELCCLNKEIIKKMGILEIPAEQKKIKKIYSLVKTHILLKKLTKESSKIILSMDHDLIGLIFILLKKSYILYEEGVVNYNFQEVWWTKLLKKIRLEIKNYGRNSRAKKIYLTGLAPIPKEIAHKVEIINLKELWSKKTLEEQNKILNIFSFDLDIKKKIQGKELILFTQPLSEDGIITEKEKIEIYSKIIKKYPKDKLIIKTHPREKTNYKNLFKECLVLDNPFPFEILNLLDLKFNKAITLFSTAALGLGKEVEVDFYGTEVHMKILERFGSCDNIMKRNCFLKEE